MALVARLHGVRDVRVADEAVPAAGAGESLVEVSAVGLCGSDLHWFAEGGIGDAVLSRPLVPGHEMAGRIRGGPRDGTRVAIDPSQPCLHCDMCLRGMHNLCRNVVFAGHSSCDGGMQRYLAWPDHLLYDLPDSVDDAAGAMLEPLGVAIHAVDLGHARLGASAAVIGLGPIGLCVLQVLRAAGIRVAVAADPLPHRRAAAVRLGVATVLDPHAHGYRDALEDVTGGVGVDVAFEMAGNDDAIDAAVDVVRPGARVVLGGIPEHDRSSFLASGARRKGLTLALVRRMNDVYGRAIDLVASGQVDVSDLVTDRFPLSRAAEAFSTATARRGLKVLVEPARAE